MLGPESAEKQAFDKRFEGLLDVSLVDLVVPENAPRVFSYELDDEVLAFQRQEYLNEPLFVPELWATYRLLVRLFEGPLRAPGPDQADLCFLPLFLPVFEAIEFDLRPTISSLELLNAGPRHVVASLWDGYPRPPSRRANPYSMQSLGYLLEPTGVDSTWSWIDERWRVLTLCGSIDVDPDDVNASRWSFPTTDRQVSALCCIPSAAPPPMTRSQPITSAGMAVHQLGNTSSRQTIETCSSDRHRTPKRGSA